MKRVLYIVSALLLLAGCAKEQNANEEVHQIPLNISIAFDAQTRAGGSETIAPVVNSVRVLGFDANDADKICVLNEFFPFGYTVMKTTSSYLVQMSTPITINSQSTKYDLYVILNEESYQLTSQSGDATIKDILTDFTEGDSKESDFTAIYNTLAVNDKTDTTGHPVGEPAFLMCASSLDYEITDAEQKLAEPQEVQFIVPGGRTMAQVIIEKITSSPYEGGTAAAVSPLVFVKSVSLENVPSTIDWNEPTSTATVVTSMKSIQVGSAETDAADNSVYYKRIWPGYLYADVAVNAQMTQTTDARMYIGDKSGFLELDQQERNLKRYAKNDWDNTAKTAKNANNEIVAQKFKPLFDNAANKNLFEVDAENTNSFYSVTGVTETNLLYALNRLTYTDDAWTVNLGKKYYVPENIVTEETATDALDNGATYIEVVLAVASPTLNLSGVTDPDWWPSPGEMTRTSNYTCYMPYTGTGSTDGEIAIASNGAASINDATAKLVAKENMHIVYVADRDIEVDPDTPKNDLTGDMNVYFDGFYRKASGTSTIKVNQNQQGGEFKWNVPDETGSYTFRIPVNNNIDKVDDEHPSYSVNRNTRYKITLHVTSNPAAATPLSVSAKVSNSNLGMTAIVETEKINDYED